MPPPRPDEGLHLPGDREPVLGHCLIERKRLPESRVVHSGARLGNDQRRVGRRIALVGVVPGLQCTVVPAVPDHGGGDAVAERGRRVALRAREVDPVAERLHRPRQLVERRANVRGVAVAPQQDAVSGEADRRLPCGEDVGSPALPGDEVAVRLRVVGRPGIPHCGGDVEEVTGVRRRSR